MGNFLFYVESLLAMLAINAAGDELAINDDGDTLEL
jgi:hypothetical protein